MLTEIADLQQDTSEVVQGIDMTFDVQTRDKEADELVDKTYTFAYAPEWDKWMFHEFVERRTPDTAKTTDRDWRRTRHCLWQDVGDLSDIHIPPQVTTKITEATGAESVTVQVPAAPANTES